MTFTQFTETLAGDTPGTATTLTGYRAGPADAPRKILAISAYNLQDVSTADNPLFRWLWTRRPIAKIGYSIFVYDLTNDQEGIIKLEEIYVKPRSP